MIEIKTAEDLKSILVSGKTCIIDCFASWCGPCKKILPAYIKLSEEYSKDDSISFYKMNIETDEEEIQKIITDNDITSIPYFLIYKDGKVDKTCDNLNLIKEYLTKKD